MRIHEAKFHHPECPAFNAECNCSAGAAMIGVAEMHQRRLEALGEIARMTPREAARRAAEVARRAANGAPCNPVP
jgi:hypothetical protein